LLTFWVTPPSDALSAFLFARIANSQRNLSIQFPIRPGCLFAAFRKGK
jgi:hypothetical protein